MKFCNAPNCSNPVFGKGFCRNHQYKREDFDKRSIVQRGIDKHKEQQKVKPKGWFDVDKVDIEREKFPNMETIHEERERGIVIVSGGGELQRWFEDRRKEMTGKCDNCGGKSCRDDDKYWKFSIAHLMPKAYIKSVATHPDNWLELCHFGNGCHSMMDNKMLDLTEMSCWDKIITRFVSMYPSIDKKERRRIPNVLLQYIQAEI